MGKPRSHDAMRSPCFVPEQPHRPSHYLRTNPHRLRGRVGVQPAGGEFLWGAATAGHQVEGNLLNDDCWLLENLPNSMFKEPSRDACDQYHLFENDIALLASFGLNAYRFSVDWSRIEPVQGAFSPAEIGHYRRMLEVCHKHDVAPVVTYNHDAVPAWFAFAGAWENPEAPALFARYCARVTRDLGDLMSYATTLNEPNLPMLFRWMRVPGKGILSDLLRRNLPRVRTQTGKPKLSTYFIGDPERMTAVMLSAHGSTSRSRTITSAFRTIRDPLSGPAICRHCLELRSHKAAGSFIRKAWSIAFA